MSALTLRHGGGGHSYDWWEPVSAGGRRQRLGSLTLKPGIRLGPYEILSPLSVVGLGELYLGRDHEQGRNVTIRVLRFATDADSMLLARVAADLLAAGVLTHPSIPRLYEVGTTADTVYVVSEPFDGETLRTLVDHGDLTVDTARQCLADVESALASAEEHRISHGDLRAENVLLTSERRTVVLGFGLAAALGGDAPSDEVALLALRRDLLPPELPMSGAPKWWRRPAVAVAVGLLALAIGIAVLATVAIQRARQNVQASRAVAEDARTLNGSAADVFAPPPEQMTEGIVGNDALVPIEEAVPAPAFAEGEVTEAVPEGGSASGAAAEPLDSALSEGAAEEANPQTALDDLPDTDGQQPLLVAGDDTPAPPPAPILASAPVEASADATAPGPVLGADDRDSRSLIAEAIVRAAEFDLPGAMELLSVTAGRGDAGSEVPLIYLRGLVDAREAFRDGGAVAALAPVHGAIEALGTISQGRSGSAEIARLVLQAAAAAAQSERDEMRLYLETAMQMELIQSAAGLPGAPIVSATELAGDLWLQVDRYEDARQAYADASYRLGPSLRNMVGSDRASSRLKDVLEACRSYGALLETWSTRPGLPSEVAEARRYVENVCAPADVPGAETPS